MSVVAGCSLLDGVILGADCRVTFKGRGGPTHRDTLQKLIFLTDHIAVGLTGDITTAAILLKAMLKVSGKRSNPIVIRQWLPRFFKYEFGKLRNPGEVQFMVGSVLPGRPNVIDKAKGAKMVFDAFASRPSGGINGISPRFLQVMNVPTQSVTILDAPQGLLYTMKSPGFTVQSYDPFDMVAIGSGEGLKKKIIEVSDQIFFGTIPNSDIQWFGRSMKVDQIRSSSYCIVGRDAKSEHSVVSERASDKRASGHLRGEVCWHSAMQLD